MEFIIFRILRMEPSKIRLLFKIFNRTNGYYLHLSGTKIKCFLWNAVILRQTLYVFGKQTLRFDTDEERGVLL